MKMAIMSHMEHPSHWMAVVIEESQHKILILSKYSSSYLTRHNTGRDVIRALYCGSAIFGNNHFLDYYQNIIDSVSEITLNIISGGNNAIWKIGEQWFNMANRIKFNCKYLIFFGLFLTTFLEKNLQFNISQLWHGIIWQDFNIHI